MTDRDLPATFRRQADMLANRVKKRYAHLSKRFARENIDVFRLYDWDIPEIRATVDWYAGRLVISEYMRRQSTPGWLATMANAVAQALEVLPENIHLKERHAGCQDGKRYQRLDFSDQRLVVSERDLRFGVNLSDYVDTGLFSDHRNTRQMVRDAAGGKDFLNLFCYTGTFTCYAAKGGARTTVSVDRSETALRWAKANLALNAIPETGNTLIRAHTIDFFEKAERKSQSFDLAVVDPPSFSTSRSRKHAFDVVRDHPALLQSVVRLMRAGASIFFSTNHQDFRPHFEELKISDVREITAVTIPEDYAGRNKTIHRCWKITV